MADNCQTSERTPGKAEWFSQLQPKQHPMGHGQKVTKPNCTPKPNTSKPFTYVDGFFIQDRQMEILQKAYNILQFV